MFVFVVSLFCVVCVVAMVVIGVLFALLHLCYLPVAGFWSLHSLYILYLTHTSRQSNSTLFSSNNDDKIITSYPYLYRCHLAKNNYTGKQLPGPFKAVNYQDWHPTLSLTDDSKSGAKGRSCVVLYQTPIVHISGKIISMEGRFETASKLLRAYFRLKKGVIGKGLYELPYEVWNAPTLWLENRTGHKFDEPCEIHWNNSDGR